MSEEVRKFLKAEKVVKVSDVRKRMKESNYFDVNYIDVRICANCGVDEEWRPCYICRAPMCGDCACYDRDPLLVICMKCKREVIDAWGGWPEEKK